MPEGERKEEEEEWEMGCGGSAICLGDVEGGPERSNYGVVTTLWGACEERGGRTHIFVSRMPLGD